MNTGHDMKTLISYKLLDEAVAAVEAEAERTGKTKTAVIEDAILMRRQFGDEAEAAAQFLAKKHKLPLRKVLEFAVLKAAGIGDKLPFDYLAAA